MKYPLVIFDLDGTILDDTIFIWKTMHDHYQTDPVRRRQAFDDYRNGKIDYRRWTEIDLELLREKKASKSELQTPARQCLCFMCSSYSSLKKRSVESTGFGAV